MLVKVQGGGPAFDKLAQHVEQEYLQEGYSPRRAAHIGKATAAKVYREKEAAHGGEMKIDLDRMQRRDYPEAQKILPYSGKRKQPYVLVDQHEIEERDPELAEVAGEYKWKPQKRPKLSAEEQGERLARRIEAAIRLLESNGYRVIGKNAGKRVKNVPKRPPPPPPPPAQPQPRPEDSRLPGVLDNTVGEMYTLYLGGPEIIKRSLLQESLPDLEKARKQLIRKIKGLNPDVQLKWSVEVDREITRRKKKKAVPPEPRRPVVEIINSHQPEPRRPVVEIINSHPPEPRRPVVEIINSRQEGKQAEYEREQAAIDRAFAQIPGPAPSPAAVESLAQLAQKETVPRIQMIEYIQRKPVNRKALAEEDAKNAAALGMDIASYHKAVYGTGLMKEGL